MTPGEDAPVRPGPVYLTVLVIASCGLVYELVAGTLASYLLGDSITQFSLVIGIYLTAMGLGAYLTKFVTRNVARRFVEVEIAVALIGGLSAPALFFAFSSPRWFGPVFFAILPKVLPFSLKKEMEEDQNVALAIVLGAIILALAIIIAASVTGG